jgi:hypothetical protein
VSSGELAIARAFNSKALRTESALRAMLRHKRRCIFRFEARSYLIVMQSKNKALDHSFNSKVWALPGVELLKVSKTLLLVVRRFFKVWGGHLD